MKYSLGNSSFDNAKSLLMNYTQGDASQILEARSLKGLIVSQ